MSLRWEDERYVRLYTRDTPEWTSLSGPACGLFCLLIRAADRAGLIPLGRKGIAGLATFLRWPVDSLAPLVDELEADGCIQIVETTLMIPNFIEAQEAKSSDAQRKRDQRERDRAKVQASYNVVDTTLCHDLSQPVTDGHSYPSLPILTKPSLAEVKAVPEGTASIPVQLVIQEAPVKKAKTDPGESYQVVALYRELWVARFKPVDGQPPTVPDAGFKHAKNLVKTYGLDSALAYVRRFVSDPDPFIAKRGHLFVDVTSRVTAYRANGGNGAPRQGVGYSPAPSGHNEETEDVTDKL